MTTLPDPTPTLARKHSLAGLRRMRATWKVRLANRRRKLKAIRKTRTALKPRTKMTPAEKRDQLHKWMRLENQAMTRLKRIDEAIAWKRLPLRLRALAVARECVGIREQGGNNQGREVMAIIRANGGTGPEPWCGDGVAYCYRTAGSKAVQRLWAAVRYIGRLSGTRILPSIRKALAGDLVCFRFPNGGDHVAIQVGYCNASGAVKPPSSATHVHTIDFNAGGDDVSDSARGGDGVVEKIRPIGMVERMVRVSR